MTLLGAVLSCLGSEADQEEPTRCTIKAKSVALLLGVEILRVKFLTSSHFSSLGDFNLWMPSCNSNGDIISEYSYDIIGTKSSSIKTNKQVSYKCGVLLGNNNIHIISQMLNIPYCQASSVGITI